ncbi:hypothetical protein NKG94_48090 [Micromonospora sp. M12]
MAGFLPGPAGEPVIFVCPFYSGPDLDAGSPWMDRLRALGTPLVDQIGPMPYADALRMFDGGMVDGNHYLLRTRWLPALTDGAVDALVAAARQVSSPFSALALHHFHGAATRVRLADTAFGLRTDHLLTEIIAVWAPDDQAAPHRVGRAHLGGARPARTARWLPQPARPGGDRPGPARLRHELPAAPRQAPL